MNNPDTFCVYLTVYSGNKLPPFYIGSTSTKKIFDLHKPYRGTVSSKRYKDIWIDELKQNPLLFNIKILKYFSIRKYAYDYEEYIQRKLNVVNNCLYINRSIANRRPNIGRTVSKETKLKISKYQKGKSKSEEHKKKIGDGNRGKKHTDEFKLGISLRSKNNTNRLGFVTSDETKLKQSIAAKNFYDAGGLGSFTGRTHTAESNLKNSISQLKIPHVICPHCNKSGRKGPMIQHHFDKCKLKK